MTGLLAAFQFLTIFPALIRRPFRPDELGSAVSYFPLVGLALGGLLYALGRGLGLIFPNEMVAVLLLVAWLLLTRALHFDGFLDSCDGLFGGFSPERRLEIMRDSRVGAFAVAGGGLLLLTKFVSISSLSALNGLILAPVLGRWAITMAVFAFPYAREEGMGRDMKDHVAWKQVIIANLVASIAACLIAGWTGLIALGLAAILLWLTAKFILRRLPGLTGDSYGAICELVELAVLMFFVTGVSL